MLSNQAWKTSSQGVPAGSPSNFNIVSSAYILGARPSSISTDQRPIPIRSRTSVANEIVFSAAIAKPILLYIKIIRFTNNIPY